jgi:uncharacterized RmlC-like cupin family protein
MTTAIAWRDGVKIVRAGTLRETMAGPAGTGRTTAFHFAGTGGHEPWLGLVALPPDGRTGPHHHGRHEVAVYVVRGRGEIRWGERLEFGAGVGPGDFVYFAPYVPHQERNLGAGEIVEFVVMRSDNAGILVDLDLVPVEHPEMVD